MGIFLDLSQVPAVPENVKILLDSFTSRNESRSTKAYDACLEHLNGCMVEWNEVEAPLALPDYQDVVVGFFAGGEDARHT